MPKRLGSVEVIQVLEQHGFQFASQKGSHCKYKSAAGRIAIVPHPRKELPIGTTRSIIRQSGLTPRLRLLRRRRLTNLCGFAAKLPL